MITFAVMALVKDHKRVISQFEVASTQAVEEHLWDHYSYSGFLHLIQKLFPSCHIGLNSFSFGNGLVLVSLSMHTNNLIIQVLNFPT